MEERGEKALSMPKLFFSQPRRTVILCLLAIGVAPVTSLAKPELNRGRKMNQLPPDILQIPNLKATHPPQAVAVLVSALLAMERIVSQKSDLETEEKIIGKVEYTYPKGPGGPLSCRFKIAEFSYFNGGFKRNEDSSPWYKCGLLIAEDEDPHPVNVAPGFYRNALGLVFEKSLRRDPLPQYSNDSINIFYFRSEKNQNIQYAFESSLETSDLQEQFPKNFFQVEIINKALEKQQSRNL